MRLLWSETTKYHILHCTLHCIGCYKMQLAKVQLRSVAVTSQVRQTRYVINYHRLHDPVSRTDNVNTPVDLEGALN